MLNIMNSGNCASVSSALLNPLLDMLSASIRKEDRVGSLDPPGAIGRLAGVEVCPVVVVVHPVLVVVRVRLLLAKELIICFGMSQ